MYRLIPTAGQDVGYEQIDRPGDQLEPVALGLNRMCHVDPQTGTTAYRFPSYRRPPESLTKSRGMRCSSSVFPASSAQAHRRCACHGHHRQSDRQHEQARPRVVRALRGAQYDPRCICGCGYALEENVPSDPLIAPSPVHRSSLRPGTLQHLPHWKTTGAMFTIEPSLVEYALDRSGRYRRRRFVTKLENTIRSLERASRLL
jgi:hypothetical protein